MLKYYITERKNEERKKTKEEEKGNERTKDSKIHAITKKKCDERDVNGKYQDK